MINTTLQLPRSNQGTAGARILRSPAKIDSRFASLGLSRARGLQSAACCFESLKAARLPVGFPILEYPRLRTEKAMGKILNQRCCGNTITIKSHAKPNCSKSTVNQVSTQDGSPTLLTGAQTFFTDARDLFAHYACVITWHAFPRASRHCVTSSAIDHKNDAVHLVHPCST